ncbi:hypothetical protein [Thalassoroseus pseudoceratinae]|uniref:hypothetical protein n=1 Tax=Thalassoroseus pseudoceratinae TaxID=2713176 RepID=UPI001423ABE1|nr:hypothetical protein [Thalassoroseus pseudoceratinae]
MTVTYEKPVRIDEATFRLNFSSDVDTPVTFRIFKDRRLVETQVSSSGSGEFFLSVGVGESPFVEVLDKNCDIPQIAFSGSIYLNWLAVSGAASYVVAEYVSSSWIDRETILDNGEGVFLYRTRWLEDVTTHQYRVTPVDSAGNEGTPLTFSIFMVRHPDVPNVSYTYDSGSVTIAAV